MIQEGDITNMDKIIKGMFVSLGEDGLIETRANLNEKTGELSVFDVDGEIQYNQREEQFFESEDGKKHYMVCPICHEYIMKIKIDDEKEFCMNGCNE